MSNKQHIVVPALLGVTVLTLVAKKLQLPFSSALTIIVLDALAGYFLLSSLRLNRKKFVDKRSEVKMDIGVNYLVYCGASLALLINLQHWRGAEPWAKIMFIVLLAFSFPIVTTFPHINKMKKIVRREVYLSSYLPFIFFISIISLAAISTPRQFYNTFHGNTYEQFVRHRYSEEVADAYIRRNKPVDERSIQRARIFYEDAKSKIVAQDYETALKLLHRAIDLNPDDAQAYYERGMLRLTKLELSVYAAQDALGDFNRALRLQPDFPEAASGKATAEQFIERHS